MEFIVSENIKVVADGQKILLEKGDTIVMENDDRIQQLKAEYKEANARGDSEKAGEIATFLDGIGVSLD